MGVLSGLLTLPLAPVRGVMWISEQLHEMALREISDPQVIRQRLTEVEDALADGEITQEEADRLQEELVRRLMESSSPSTGAASGGLAVGRRGKAEGPPGPAVPPRQG